MGLKSIETFDELYEKLLEMTSADVFGSVSNTLPVYDPASPVSSDKGSFVNTPFGIYGSITGKGKKRKKLKVQRRKLNRSL